MRFLLGSTAAMCLVLAVACRSAAESSAPSGVEVAAREAAAALDRQLTSEGFRGAFLVALGEEHLLAKGYGYVDRAQTVRATTSTAFWTASIAKSFTAAAVMHLVDRGALALSDRVADHLVGLPPTWGSMTVRHLLTHTSGIRQNYAADAESDRDAALERIHSMPLGFSPGEDWAYSNDAYTTLAILIEVVSGQTYERYLRDALFVPAGLENSGFRADPPAELAEFADPSYDQRSATWGFRGGHGIATTALDLHRWWLALRSHEVLSPRSTRSMLAPQARVRDTLTTGYGWFQEETAGGHSVVWTRGTDQSGENACVYVLPEYDFVVIGLSHHDGDRDPVTRRMAMQAIALFEEALTAAE